MADRTRGPRNAWWYVAAIVLAFGGYLLGVSVAASSWSLLTDATVRPAETALDAGDGRTVGVFADVVQTDRDVSCRTGGKGKPRRPIEATPINPTTTQDGTTWTLIAETSDAVDGTQVVCRPKDGASDPATYGVTVVDGYSSRINLGNGIMWLSVVAGLALGIWVFMTRRADASAGLASARSSAPASPSDKPDDA